MTFDWLASTQLKVSVCCCTRCEPNEPAALSKLAQLGVLYWQLDADLHETDPKLAAIRKVYNYSYMVSTFCVGWWGKQKSDSRWKTKRKISQMCAKATCEQRKLLMIAFTFKAWLTFFFNQPLQLLFVPTTISCCVQPLGCSLAQECAFHVKPAEYFMFRPSLWKMLDVLDRQNKVFFTIQFVDLPTSGWKGIPVAVCRNAKSKAYAVSQDVQLSLAEHGRG